MSVRYALSHGADELTGILSRREAFTASNLEGRRGGAMWDGRLPREYRPMLQRADYVIYSYSTPVAWRDTLDGLWFVPPETYSQSTTRQQNMIRQAIAPLNRAVVNGEDDGTEQVR